MSNTMDRTLYTGIGPRAQFAEVLANMLLMCDCGVSAALMEGRAVCKDVFTGEVVGRLTVDTLYETPVCIVHEESCGWRHSRVRAQTLRTDVERP